MDPYEQKLRDMQQYLPFLAEKIERLKQIKLKSSYPDPVREARLERYQGMYKVINNKDIKKKVNVETLKKIEDLIKKMQEQDFLENRPLRKDSLPGRDYNPFYSGDAYRPGSSCSNASGGSGSGSYRSNKKVFDDTPASPSPPGSPAAHSLGSANAPIIIPTERRNRYTPISSPTLPPRSCYHFVRSPTPPPIPKMVPITRVDLNDVEPGEWDTDEEESEPSRPEIIIPKNDGCDKSEDKGFSYKEENKSVQFPKKDLSENNSLVQDDALGSARRLKSVMEKISLRDADVNRVLSSHRSNEPLSKTLEDSLRSSDPDHHIRQSPSQHQQSTVPQPTFSPSKRDAGNKSVPMTPSLLLNAPPTSSRMPIAIDDIAEFLDDNERNNLRSKQPQNSGPPRPPTRMPMSMPNSSPIMLSPRSDASTLSPCLSDPRLSGDPRSRSSNDPRAHSVPPMNNDPRNHGAMAPNDPRNHGPMPINDSRNHGSMPRYTDNYDRHKRSMQSQESPMGPNDYQRPRHMDQQFGAEGPGMGPPSMHGVPNTGPGEFPVPGPGPVPGPSPGPYNPHNQMSSHNQMGYDYRGMGQDGYGCPPGGPMQSPQQQQWNSSHMQPGPPQAVPPPHSYPMPQAPSMRGPHESPGWQPPNMYSDMSGHPMMNGDARMPGGYPNPMGRPNSSHIPPLIPNNTGYNMGPGGKYPNYPDSRQSYDMPYEQQHPNDYQRARPHWGASASNNQTKRFGNNRSSTPFVRPGAPSGNNWNKDNLAQRPNRDPRMRPEVHRPSTPPTFHAKEAPLPKGPPPGKEVHPNKLKQVAADKEASAKKKSESHKPDVNKTKEKDKERDRSKKKDKDKSKSKSIVDAMKSPLTDLYGAIDAKKAIQGPGLQKFKIPKKRPSVDARPEPSTTNEENWDDDDVVTSSSNVHESVNKQGESTTSKKSTKSGEKDDTTRREQDDNDEATETKDRKKSKNVTEMDLLKKLAATDGLSKDDLSSLVKELMKKLNKSKTKKAVIYSSDEDEDEEESDDERPSTTKVKTSIKKKKSSKQIIESSSEEDETNSETPVVSKKEKQKKNPSKKKLNSKALKEATENKKEQEKDKEIENEKSKEKKKDQDKETETETETEIEKKKLKEVEVNLGEKRSVRLRVKETAAAIEEAANKESQLEAEPPIVTEEAIPDESNTTKDAEIPTKAKPKRRFRELDMLQEDLKSSWICDGAMKATGSRTCSQKNKPQKQHQQAQDQPTPAEEETATVKSAPVGKAKKPAKVKGSKVKKAVSEISPIASEEESEEDDVPLSRRSETMSAESAKPKIPPKSTITKKTRVKNAPKVPPPLFDSSSNDSFNLDASAVEPATDISLHPENISNEKASIGKGKNLKKGGKKTAPSATDAGAESSSDESFVSNASSSLLLDTSAKQRDNNEELLDDVMAELAANPKYSVAKKKQAKKKKSNWQMGILSRKKRKKATTPNEHEESITSHESVADTSASNENSALHKEDNTTSGSNKNLDSSFNSIASLDKTNDKANDEEDVSWKSTNATDDEDMISRVDSEALIGYTFSGNEKYQCLLCPFYRKNIVHHYKVQHPKKEVLISRLPIAEANLAIEESKRLDFENNTSTTVGKEIGKYSCRFCHFISKGIDSCSRENFYEHCTNHTGEYRFACSNCNYEAVARGSIRTHYYKECRKNSTLKNLNEAIVEKSIPNEDRIYGYLCSKCNFVQLKKCNVEKHVKLWHNKEGQEEVKIIKIDMSLNLKKEEDLSTNIKEEVEDPSIVPQKIEPKDEKDIIENATETEPDVKENITLETRIEEEPEVQVTLETIEQKPEKVEKSSNLSAFVCAEELEDKDVEIQNERKKKMQEIVENIGIKVDKEEAQKRFSIIDKLKDKIETSLPIEEVESNISKEVKVPVTETTATANESVVSANPDENPEQPTNGNDKKEDTLPIPQQIIIKPDPDSSEVIEKEDKTSTKIKDPLEFVNEQTKQGDRSDDEETSDVESNVVPQVQYDSDTSAEQSDHEMSTDVNDILQNTTEIPSPSKGLMMTTIQRLAAQLQNTKPLETPPPPSEPESIISDIPEPSSPVKIKVEKTSPKKPIEDMAVLSPTSIKKEVKKESEPLQINNTEQPKAVDENSAPLVQNTSSPKTFIRIRRISGDKLSKSGDQESTFNTENDNISSTMAPIEPIEKSTNEGDTGFLKIANVVSLAQKDNDSQIVSNIRKAVETSPQKVKGLSLLKKPSYILQRVDSGGSVMTSTGETVKLIPLTIPPTSRTVTKSDSYISIGGQPAVAIKIDSKGVAVPLTIASTGSAPTSLVNSTKQPFKLVKIASPEQVSVAIKLKSANVYEKMLKDDKLIHMFKCMGRDCCFTTSNETTFHKHLKLHEEDLSNKTTNEPKDYFKCAYCYIDCKSYDDLMDHLKKMHIFCRFCCRYCFYRAFAYSYVEIHQKTYHQMNNVHILIVSEELVQRPPPPKRLERKHIIKPYVCVHACNKYFFIPEAFILHLNMHHKNIVSGFKCHLCQGSVSTVDNLIEHYKQHGYFKYHCMYCTHGSASIKELHNHLSSAHYNQPPHILERCLPREISKSLSAIDQLRVRDVDAIYQQLKNGSEEENPKVAIPPLIKTTGSPVSLIQNSPIMSAKIISPKDNTFVPLSNLDGSVSNIRILDARSLSTSTATSLLNIGKNIKVTVTETPKLSNNEALKILPIENENNEFVNVNLLDHPEILSKTNPKVDTKSADNKSIDYDSDIEIIEDYTNQPQHDTTKEKEELPNKNEIKVEVPESPKDPSQDENKEANNTKEINESTPDETKQTDLSTTGSETPTSTPKSNESPKPGRFLTLDDVKNTGFMGRELYRCGVETCQFNAETSDELRLHMQQCSPSEEDSADTTLYCVHCGPSSKRYGKPSFFLDHLKTHGIKRFSCAVCNVRFAVQSQAQSHLRAKHKYVSSKIIPADPTNPAPDGLFIVHPVTTAEKLKNKKLNRTPEKDQTKSLEMEKTTYGPNEIDSLPLQAIFIRAVQCAICPYSNKVRTNVVRHLQAHLKDESVPESSPVNPVPCLDKKERMFDKMVNLASSSHENGRMGGGGYHNYQKDLKSEEDETLPKFVPENKRYVCGVPECNYLTVEEAMLRHHLKALHSDEVYFRCPHCPTPSAGQDPAQNVALEKMGVHLKMHDSRLYKCSHCIYHHYHRHVVERHVADKHPEKRQYVRVIRELQNDQSTAESQQQQLSTTQESEETEQPDPDGNTWKCNLCDFKAVYKSAMQQHALNVHEERCQYKCNGCPFKTINKATFDQHMLTKHANESNVDYTTVYQRIKGLKKPDSTDSATAQDEPFDTTPLWRRDMPRIRHIRGILLEEEENNESVKSGKRKSDADISSKPAKIKAGKSASLDDCKTPDAKKPRTSLDETDKSKIGDGNYGPYGKPIGELYVCTVCGLFKSKYKHDFRDHLYKDLKYYRWHCPVCDYKAVNRAPVMKHFSNKHAGENLEPIITSPNPQTEEWAATVVKTQTEIMKANKASAAAVVVVAEEEEAEESEDDDLVIDTKEEEENENSEDEKVSSEVLPTPLVCKHCNMSLTKWRGFKRHVQLKHLKRLGFLCPYCDRSTNSEVVMLQHVRSKHRDLPEKVIENPNPQTSDLNAEFWEREYGLIIPKRTKKRKRKDENSDETKVEFELPCDKCDFTAITIAGLKSHMRTHETRVKQKCTYCTFISFNSSEMRQHWEVNHSHLEFKVEEAIVTTAAMDANIRAAKKLKIEDEKKATVYYCYYCDMGSTSLDAIRSHWRMMHKDDIKLSIFKYKEHSETKVKCAYCAEPGTKSILINHIWQKHGKDKPILLVEKDEDCWMCKWCKEGYFTTKEEIDYHQKIFHSPLRMNCKLVRRTFKCKQCNFDTQSLEAMQKHAKIHLNVYKCKHCPDVFKSFFAVKNHFKVEHPDKEPETRTITNDDITKEIDVIVNNSAIYNDIQLSPIKVSPSSVKTPPTSPRVAKKSTTKQTLTMVRPFPEKIKAVARKSTNPLPRYPSGIVFETEEETKPKYQSYYGRPVSPVDLDRLSTTMAVAGLKMKVNCAKLAELFKINIEPTLCLTDFRKTKNKDNR